MEIGKGVFEEYSMRRPPRENLIGKFGLSVKLEGFLVLSILMICLISEISDRNLRYKANHEY